MTTTGPVPPFENRRQHPRHAISLPVWASADGRHSRIEATNISLGGIACRSEKRFPTAARLTLSLDVAGGRGEREVKPLDLEAVVVRCSYQEGVWDLGLQFPHAQEEGRRRLALFIGSRFDDAGADPSRDDG